MRMILVAAGLGAAGANGSARAAESHFALGMIGGLPSMLGGELRYTGLSHFTFGLSFGSLPINGIINGAVDLDPQQLDLIPGKTHLLTPEARHSMFSTTLVTRYYPQGAANGGLFAQAGFSSWSFRTRFSGSLQNVTDGTRPREAISGNAAIHQAMAGLSVGYQVGGGKGFFLDFGLGGNLHFRPGRSISIGGMATSAGLAGASEEEALDEAIEKVAVQFNEAVDELSDQVRFSPTLFFTVGWGF